jgi:hypothetical protein
LASAKGEGGSRQGEESRDELVDDVLPAHGDAAPAPLPASSAEQQTRFNTNNIQFHFVRK